MINEKNNKFIAAAIQMKAGADFDDNFNRAKKLVGEAAERGAHVVGLPENFSFVRTNKNLAFISHKLKSAFVKELSSIAKRHKIYLLAGSFHEKADGNGKLFNTSIFFGTDGSLLGVYRKIHLFDITFPDGRTFRESSRFAHGDEVVVCETELANFGLSICYDLRFPELYRILSRLGTDVFFVPSAFTESTGKYHWELLLRSRSVENLCWTIAPALCGSSGERIRNWGHAMIVDPWGNVVSSAGEREDCVIYADIDIGYLKDKRQQLPALEHRRIRCETG